MLRARLDVNVLIGEGVRPEDVPLFFGDNRGVVPDSDVFVTLPAPARFPELLADLGIFASRGDARKNGWNRDIPAGWTDMTIGKLKHRICILKVLA